MSYTDIESRVTIDGTSDPAVIAQLSGLLRQIYDGSSLAAAEVDTWLANHPNQQLTLTYEVQAAYTDGAPGGSGHIHLDPTAGNGLYYISSNGEAVEATAEVILAHELGHAVTGDIDDDKFSDLDGSNDDLTNPWYAQLGLPERATYEAVSNTIIANANYTGDESIENAIVDVGYYDNAPYGGISFDSANIDLTSSDVIGASLIVGGSGGNNYTGTSSRDWIYGGGGSDVLDGGAGNDFLYGGGGSDQIRGGDGDDEIWGGDNASIPSSQLDAADQIDGGSGNDKIHGGDGGDNLAGGSGNNEIYGDAGKDKITSTGTDIVSGGADDDQIKVQGDSAAVKFGVGDGKDTVLTGLGDYQLQLDNLNPGDISFLAGGTGIYDGQGHLNFNSLTIKINATGEQITFMEQSAHDSFFDGNKARDGVEITNPGDSYDYTVQSGSLPNSPISSIKFADGSIMTASQIWDYIADWPDHQNVSFDVFESKDDQNTWFHHGLIPAERQISNSLALNTFGTMSTPVIGSLASISSSPGAYIDHLNEDYFSADPIAPPAGQTFAGTPDIDVLNDGYGDDTLTGGAGDDYYLPTYGDDAIVWNEGDGNDTVITSGAYYGNDTLVLGEGITAGNLQFAVTSNGAGLIISFDNMPGSITLSTDVAAFEGRGAFGVKFDDGTVWSHADLMAAAGDAIDAAYRNIQDDNDGNFISLPQTNFTAAGNGGDDSFIVSGDGTGTIVFGAGDGNDELTNLTDTAFRNDTLSLTDLLPGDVELARWGDALIVTITATGGTFKANDQFASADPDISLGVNRILFSDNTVWTREDIANLAVDVTPPEGGDIYGTNGNDSFDLTTSFGVHGGLGDDHYSVTGEGGGTFYFSKGDGHDELDQPDGASRSDTLILTDINSGEVTVSQDGQAAIFTVTSTGDTFRADWQFYESAPQGIEQVQFANGVTWTREDVVDIVNGRTPPGGGGNGDDIPYPTTTNTITADPSQMNGTAGNDYGMAWSSNAGGSNGTVVSGLAGDDRLINESWNGTIDGGDGNDVLEARNSDQTLTGGIGTDYFVFDIGNYVGAAYGLDPSSAWGTITDFEDGTDKIAVLGIADSFDDLTLDQVGSDVEISVAGAPKIIVANTMVGDLTADDFIVRRGGDAGTPPANGTVPYPTTTNTVAYNQDEMGGTTANDLIFAPSAENGGSNGIALLGRDGDDLLTSESWSSFLSGGAGNDVLEIRNDDALAIGGQGYDYYVFDPATFVGASWALDPQYVWATIEGFTHGEDKIVLGAGAYEDLTIAQVDNNVEISMQGAPRIILRGALTGDIDESDFVFTGSGSQQRAITEQPVTAGSDSSANRDAALLSESLATYGARSAGDYSQDATNEQKESDFWLARHNQRTGLAIYQSVFEVAA